MNEIIKNADEKMSKFIDRLIKDFGTIRAGRANPAVLDKIVVDYYGSPTPIGQVATISTPEARTLQIQPWEATLIKDIEKAILSSDLGITPSNDGRVIRLNFPAPTEERRKELVKEVHKHAEETKIVIRNARRDGIDKLKALKKDGTITEDDLKNAEKKMQDITDKQCAEVDNLFKAKEKEILEL